MVENDFRETLDGKKRQKPPTEKILDGQQEAKVIAVQLVKDTRVPIEATKEHPRRIDYEYKRAGIANVFMFTELLSGRREV